ncbi:MAG: hypothetical protein AB7F86_01460 [Bdellovibrionales bacterium]
MRVVLFALKALILVNLPAVLGIWLTLSLVEQISLTGAFYAWVLLVFVAPVAIGSFLFATIVDLSVMAGLVAYWSGRRSFQIKFGSRTWAPEDRPFYPREMKDVTPRESDHRPSGFLE